MKAGQIQFAPAAAYINNIGDFRIKGPIGPIAISITGRLSTASAGLL